jgi:hypothetical protein
MMGRRRIRGRYFVTHQEAKKRSQSRQEKKAIRAA